MSETEKKFQVNVEDFAGALVAMPDAVLERPWPWGSYDSEGVRFGVLRVIEMLGALHARTAAGRTATEADALLTDYRLAYWDLQAVLTGLSDEAAGLQPGENEWDVRTTMAHILGGELGFYAVLRFNLEAHRAGSWTEDLKIKEADFDRLLDMTESGYDEIMARPLSGLRTEHAARYRQILAAFRDVAPGEINLPSKYWEAETYPLRFRLGRFASHLRQHTIQIEKTLAATGQVITENRMLARRLFGAFAGLPESGLPPAETAEITGVMAELHQAMESG